MDRQLEPLAIDDPKVTDLLDPYQSVLLPPAEAREAYLKTLERPEPGKGVVKKVAIDTRRLIEDAQMVQFLRQVASERQVLEIMTDFWFNHFNVYALKDPVKVLVTDYIENAIRPHALAHFEDLLIATARHPAMLVYLDNHLSGAARKGGKKEKAKKKKAKKPSGITENYARELLELHTLGVHGGYTQEDVIEVARILTGWTVQDLRGNDYVFVFKPKMHDFESKVVLGVSYPEKRGEEEGVELLTRLAAHPSTARHLATKLCTRFVDETPPPGCIERLAQVYAETRGDIRALLRAVVASPEFWQHQRSKLKSPNLYLVSAYRALGAWPGAVEHAKLANSLGEPKLMQAAPTGYPEDAAGWFSTAGMLERMNFALAVAGFATPKSPDPIDDAQIVDHTNQALFAGFASPSTLEAIRMQVAQTDDLRQKLRTATALGLASPDFQHY